MYFLYFFKLSCIKNIIYRLSNEEITKIQRLPRTQLLRRIKIDFNECGQNKCTWSGCKLKNNGDVFDISMVEESYTKYKGRESWSMIYKLVENDRFLYKLVSGIHTSIAVHVSLNYKKIFGFWIPNPIYYYKRYKKEYENNLFILFLCIRKSINFYLPSYIGINFRNKKEKFFEFVNTNKKDFYKQIMVMYIGNILTSIINIKETKCLGDTTVIDKILRIVDCMECDKCRVLGRLQFLGLKYALENTNKFDPDKYIFIVLLYIKLNRTINNMQYIENLKFYYLYYLVDKLDQVLFLILLLVNLLIIKKIKSKK